MVSSGNSHLLESSVWEISGSVERFGIISVPFSLFGSNDCLHVFSVSACPVFLLEEHESLGFMVDPDVFTVSLIVGSLEPSSTVAIRFT